jgi:hypothetical protein
LRLVTVFYSLLTLYLFSQYPNYLSTTGPSLPAEDLARFKKQEVIVREIVTRFEEPGADKAPPYTAEEEAVRSKRMEAVVDLVAKVRFFLSLSSLFFSFREALLSRCVILTLLTSRR